MDTPISTTSRSEAWADRFAETLESERQRVHEFLAAQLARLERTETFVEQQIARLEKELHGQCDETERLQAERDALAAQLAEAEKQLQQAEERLVEVAPTGESQFTKAESIEDEDLRYQMALDDIRQLRNANNELREQLAKTKAASVNVSRQSQPRGTLDWEAEKQRILAALEASSEEGDEQEPADRRRITEIIQRTNQIVADKDREIQELRRQAEASAETTADAAKRSKKDKDKTIFNLVADDAVVREERERLRILQEEWREKLRQAEVEIALERAKIARQRAEMELQQHESDEVEETPHQATDERLETERSARGRWLARLGLTDADIIQGKHL